MLRNRRASGRMAAMNNRPGAFRTLRFAAGFFALFALGFAFVSGRSFWLDEVRSAAKAVQPTWAAFRAELFALGGSDVQMPLYMSGLWAWARAAGTSEWALRSLNLVFSGFALLAIATERSLPRPLRFRWGALLAVSPMAAFYLDEARPYLLLLLGGTLVAAGMARPPAAGLPDARRVRLVLAGCVLLAGASLTGAAFAAWPCLWLVLLAARGRAAGSTLRRHPIAIPATALALAALLAYYLWTLAAGFRGTHSYETTPATAGFCAYEFLGAAGLGPGRDALRALPPAAALRAAAPAIALTAAVWLGFAVVHRRAGPWRLRDLLRHPLFACTAVPVALLFAGGAAAHLRILARHLIPALPAFALAVAWSSDRAARKGAGVGDLAALALAALWLASALFLRFSPAHAREDVRAAAALARTAAEAGGTVWWGGDRWTFEYYPAPADPAAADRLHPFPGPGDPGSENTPDLAVEAIRFDGRLSAFRDSLLRKRGLEPDPSAGVSGFRVWRRRIDEPSAAPDAPPTVPPRRPPDQACVKEADMSAIATSWTFFSNFEFLIRPLSIAS